MRLAELHVLAHPSSQGTWPVKTNTPSASLTIARLAALGPWGSRRGILVLGFATCSHGLELAKCLSSAEPLPFPGMSCVATDLVYIYRYCIHMLSRNLFIEVEHVQFCSMV